MKQINFNSISMYVQKTLPGFYVFTLVILIVLIESCNQAPKQPATQTVADPSQSTNKNDNSNSNKINRDKSINMVKAYIDDIDSKLLAIDEGIKGNDYRTISEHAGEIEEIASKIKQEATIFSSSEFELIKRSVSEIQHGGDEIKDAVKGHSHEDIHHAVETVKRQCKTLMQDVAKL